jgi:hypothetical protein
MNKLAISIGTLCVAALLCAGSASAQAPAAPAAPATAAADAAKPAAAAKAKPSRQFTPKTAKSKECSMKADEQKLRGKARQKFRADCKKAA